MSDHHPVFILGCPRSGTTMLGGLFKHTKWDAAFESHVVVKYANKYERGSASQRQAVIKQMLHERPMQQFGIQVDEGLETATKRSFAELTNHLFSGQREPGLWADKTPWYSLHMEKLHELYPESKIVFICRDGRDVALSLMKKSWGPANIYACAQMWREYNVQPSIARLEGKGVLLRVRFEDILSNPQGEWGRITSFVGSHSSQLDVSQFQRGRAQAWKSVLSRREQEVFDHVAGDCLKDLGYECLESSKQPSPLAVAWFGAHQRAKTIGNLVWMNTIDVVRIRLGLLQPFAD